jgi:hypothetical protein
MPTSNDKSNPSHHTRNAPEEGPAAQGTFVVDAGAAPVELIKRARPVAVDLTSLDAGPPRISAVEPRAEPGVPLNPLRAGAAIATGVTRSEANPQISDASASADMEGGRAPGRPVGKKEPPSRSRKAKAKRTRTRKGKR